MKQIIIEKKDEEITYRKSETTVEFLVNGKRLRVYIHEDYDDLTGTDYDIDEEDLKALTDEEREIFEDEGVWNLSKMKDGEKLSLDGWNE